MTNAARGINYNRKTLYSARRRSKCWNEKEEEKNREKQQKEKIAKQDKIAVKVETSRPLESVDAKLSKSLTQILPQLFALLTHRRLTRLESDVIKPCVLRRRRSRRITRRGCPWQDFPSLV